MKCVTVFVYIPKVLLRPPRSSFVIDSSQLRTHLKLTTIRMRCNGCKLFCNYIHSGRALCIYVKCHWEHSTDLLTRQPLLEKSLKNVFFEDFLRFIGICGKSKFAQCVKRSVKGRCFELWGRSRKYLSRSMRTKNIT